MTGAGGRLKRVGNWPSLVIGVALVFCAGLVFSTHPVLPASAAQAVQCLDGAAEPQAVLAACADAVAAASGPEAKAHLLAEMAKVHRKAGALDAAAAAANEAIELAPGLADAWIEKGYVLRANKDFDAALAAHIRALEAEPGYWRAVLVKIDALANAGRYVECLAAAEQALIVAPERAHTYAYRGRCLAEIGRTEEAIKDYEKAAQIGLEEAFLYSNMALAYLDSGNPAKALEAAGHAIALDTRDEFGQLALVDALIALGRNQEALEAYEAAQAATVPDTIGRANALAWELYLKGDYAAAEPVMAGYFAADPQPGPEQSFEADTYAHILAALGQKDKAVEMYLLAAELGGAEKASSYRQGLTRLGIKAKPDLAAALQTCVDKGAACRISD